MRMLLLVVAIIAATVALTFNTLERHWQAPLTIDPGGYQLTIHSGESLRDVVDRLQQRGVVSHPYLLLAYGRWTGLDVQIKRGEYLVRAGTTAGELLQQLRIGNVIQYQLTLPEGITLARAITVLASQENLEQVLSGVQDPRIIALINPHQSGEGLFFPDSYRYEKGTSDWQILQRAHRAMQVVLAQEWQLRAPGLPYETPYEALVMASIVERETGVADERPQIAGVFVRRLLKKMRLQTDPSVIYGLGENFDGNLRRSHLQDVSNPYNSYRHKGLPPTPIALPGRAAINASLQPAAGETLYFVARGDGSHQFSTTLKEHQNAVRKYQLNRAKNYRSSPGNH